MQLVKRTYVDSVHSLAATPAFAGLGRAGREAEPYSWRRWAASLLAIYDTERMTHLDCPWWNVAATREVEQFLAARNEARVFEYGSGASTVWIAKRAASVVTVEHDERWMTKVRELLATFGNVELMHRAIDDGGAQYANAICEVDGRFDMIVIDGRHRAACLQAALPRLAEGGIVLFDDSGRDRYRAAIRGSGMAETRHYGRSFCVPYPDHTSILRRHD